MFDRLVGEKCQDRHCDRRHTVAFRTGIAGATRAVLHAVEDVEQTHGYLPVACPPGGKHNVAVSWLQGAVQGECPRERPRIDRHRTGSLLSNFACAATEGRGMDAT